MRIKILDLKININLKKKYKNTFSVIIFINQNTKVHKSSKIGKIIWKTKKFDKILYIFRSVTGSYSPKSLLNQ